MWLVATVATAPRGGGRATPDDVRESRAATVNPEPMPVGGGALRGSPEAPVAVLLYSDFQCPYCAQFARDTLPQLIEQYIDTGRVQLRFRHLPLERLHPLALPAAEAAECARRQDRFWEMHDELFSRLSGMAAVDLLRIGEEIGLGTKAYSACMAAGDAAETVRKEAEVARRLGITGTPTLLLGTIDAQGTFTTLRREGGAIPFSILAGMLEGILRRTEPAVPARSD